MYGIEPLASSDLYTSLSSLIVLSFEYFMAESLALSKFVLFN